jgi:hypothetical protein
MQPDGTEAEAEALPVELDKELRRRVAKAYYQLRSNGFVQLPLEKQSSQLTRHEIDRISVQLIEMGHLSVSRLDRLMGRSISVKARLTVGAD